jgi:hypothetical protein
MAGRPGDDFDPKTKGEMVRDALHDLGYERDSSFWQMQRARGNPISDKTHILDPKVYDGIVNDYVSGKKPVFPTLQTQIEHIAEKKLKDLADQQSLEGFKRQDAMQERGESLASGHKVSIPGHQRSEFRDGSSMEVYYGADRGELDSYIIRDAKGEVLDLGRIGQGAMTEQRLGDIRRQGGLSGSVAHLGAISRLTNHESGHVTWSNPHGDSLTEANGRVVFVPAEGTPIETVKFVQPEARPAAPQTPTAAQWPKISRTPESDMIETFQDGETRTTHTEPGGKVSSIVIRDKDNKVTGIAGADKVVWNVDETRVEGETTIYRTINGVEVRDNRNIHLTTVSRDMGQPAATGDNPDGNGTYALYGGNGAKEQYMVTRGKDGHVASIEPANTPGKTVPFTAHTNEFNGDVTYTTSGGALCITDHKNGTTDVRRYMGVETHHDFARVDAPSSAVAARTAPAVNAAPLSGGVSDATGARTGTAPGHVEPLHGSVGLMGRGMASFDRQMLATEGAFFSKGNLAAASDIERIRQDMHGVLRGDRISGDRLMTDFKELEKHSPEFRAAIKMIESKTGRPHGGDAPKTTSGGPRILTV